MYNFEVVSDTHRMHPDKEIILPRRATKNAAAYDFFSPETVTIQPNEGRLIWTDVKAHIPTKYCLVLNIRSSMGCKAHMSLANTSGWIDSDYYANESNDGNIGIMLYNGGVEPYHVNIGDRIAQGMILKYHVMDDDSVSTIRDGGFGSTGK